MKGRSGKLLFPFVELFPYIEIEILLHCDLYERIFVFNGNMYIHNNSNLIRT